MRLCYFPFWAAVAERLARFAVLWDQIGVPSEALACPFDLDDDSLV